VRVFKRLVRCLPAALVLTLASCATKDRDHVMRVSVPDQKMIVFNKGVEIARYDVSTSKFGLGDKPGSKATPLGALEVARKIGDGAPLGMKFKSRRPTGEIVAINAPGRDPIVTRILWLRGLEPQNRNAYDRMIYIHGTAEEWRIGTPASYGCIRMRSQDVIALFNTVGIGARVEISTSPFPAPLVAPPAPTAPASAAPALAPAQPTPPPASASARPSSKRG
jgi:hypothetical protein